MPDELLMRQVPQDLTAEQSLLGAMLVDPNCIPEFIEQRARYAVNLDY